MGTYYDGLDCYDPKSGLITHFTTKEGLSNNTIRSIVEDEKGHRPKVRIAFRKMKLGRCRNIEEK